MLISCHAVVTGFMSDGRIIFANLNDPSGVKLIWFLEKTSNAELNAGDRSCGCVVAFNLWYAGQFSSSLFS